PLDLVAKAVVDLARPEERVAEVVAVGEALLVALEGAEGIVSAFGEEVRPAEGPEVLAVVAEVALIDRVLEVVRREVEPRLVARVELRAQHERLGGLLRIGILLDDPRQTGQEVVVLPDAPRGPRAEEEQRRIGDPLRRRLVQQFAVVPRVEERPDARAAIG